MILKEKWLIKLIRFWPPFLGTGIRIREVHSDLSYIVVQMKLNFWNRNYVGTHYGGSLYSMTDPFYMLMLLSRMGPQYVIWDKSAKIKYLKAVKHTVYAHFKLKDAQIQQFKDQLKTTSVIEPVFHIDIVSKDNEIVAQVEKTIHISKKTTRKKLRRSK